jgi:hypothetical protein
MMIICVELKTTRPSCEHYDIEANLQCPKKSNMEKVLILGFRSQNIYFSLKTKNITKLEDFLIDKDNKL